MKMFNLFEKSVVYIAVLMAFGGADAAQNGRASVMPTMNTTAARMPTIPAVSVTTIGNPAVTAISQTGSLPTVVPQPTPDPDPDPDPKKECPDGGVKNSTYTTAMCMNDILQCINSGALQGGLNAMFNEEVRNAIMGGMRICQTQIDKCISTVRKDCKYVYTSTADVWMGFNCSIVQSEYYNFVLRKTGLTPNQAENTCLLLDRNTYGPSFAAVSDVNDVNNEYGRAVKAYNAQGDSKDNPQGVMVNTTGYDGNRGHYARWDATNAECLIRVAAYNKDNLITNSWLFGAVGDDNPAEVWQKAGGTFTCNKDLFDMSSLLNDTRTAAVISVPGGAVLGTAIGAGAGAGVYKKKHEEYEDARTAKTDPCSSDEYRRELAAAISSSGKGELLKSYAWKDFSVDADNKVTGTAIFDGDYNWNDLADDEDTCRDLRRVYEKVALYESVIKQCEIGAYANISKTITNVVAASSNTANGYEVTQDAQGNSMFCIAEQECGDTITEGQEQITSYLNECLFIPLQIQDMTEGTGVRCNHDNKCLNIHQVKYQVNELKKLSSAVRGLLDEDVKDADKGKEIGKGAAIGAATGLGVGALITGITALVEKGNISCKVGDGLNSVSLGKSHSIDSLKDFYVKWNLHLPDSGFISADKSNATYGSSLEQMCFNYFKTKESDTIKFVANEVEWMAECANYNDNLFKCPTVRVYYQNTSNLVENACEVKSNKCVLNKKVFDSYKK